MQKIEINNQPRLFLEINKKFLSKDINKRYNNIVINKPRLILSHSSAYTNVTHPNVEQYASILYENQFYSSLCLGTWSNEYCSIIKTENEKFLINFFIDYFSVYNHSGYYVPHDSKNKCKACKRSYPFKLRNKLCGYCNNNLYTKDLKPIYYNKSFTTYQLTTKNNYTIVVAYNE